LASSSFAVQGQSNERKEYRSTEYQFSARYPDDWRMDFPKDYSFSDERRDHTGIVVFVSPIIWDEGQKNSAAISICSQPIDRQLNDFAKSYCHQQDYHLGGIAKHQVLSRRRIKVNGVDAERIATKVTHDERYYYYVSFAINKRRFFITGSFYKSPSRVFDTFKYEPEFDKIVESFRFIDMSDNN
jgi:hypothetical protein